jgi:hypothetical protein
LTKVAKPYIHHIQNNAYQDHAAATAATTANDVPPPPH